MGLDLASIMKGGVEGVLGSVATIIGKFKADPNIAAQSSATIAQAEAALQTAQLQIEGQLALAQLEINKAEAQSTDKFTNRARPAAMWICNIGFLYATILFPLFTWISENYGWKSPPQLNIEVLMPTMGILLGVGTMRSYDKMKGTSR